MADPEPRVGEENEEVEEAEDEEISGGITARILHRSDVLATLQGRLHTDIMQTLPNSVKRRVKALKKMQLEATHIEAKFYEEVHQLECKYHQLYTPLYVKRSHIVRGNYEPNEDECVWASSEDEKEPETEEISKDIKTKVKIEDLSEDEKDKKLPENTKGIPDFWLTIFKNVQLLSEMVQDHDEPILKHLEDIKVNFLEKNPLGFSLEFHFTPNEYFTNKVLTKTYEMKCAPDESDPFSFEGPEIYKCKGTPIDWHKGKNVTIKTIKKKQKHKSRGSVRTVSKTVQNDSFFHFFAPPCMPDDPEAADMDEETQNLLTSDFEIGHYIRERIVPRAILYYTGEAMEDDDYDEEEDDDDDQDDDDDEEDDEEYFPKLSNSQFNKNANPADCKQQ